MKAKLFLLLSVLVYFSCSKKYETPDNIKEINIDVKVNRFEKDFFNTNKENISKLKLKYPYMVPKNVVDVDSLWLSQKKDTLLMEILEETNKVFSDFELQELEIELLFKHIKYYFPEFKHPDIVTITSGVAYREKVELHDGLLFVFVDTYLGADHKFYEDLPRYIAANLKKEQIVSDIANLYAKKFVNNNKKRSFIDQMVYFGKLLYLKDLFMPFDTEESRISYSKEQLEWARANESEIWSYFVEKNLLFSTDTSLSNRFIAKAPFSKFYLELDNESPGMIGRYIGWQIVRSFMKKNNVSLRELSTISGQELFNKAKYKPAK